MPSGKLGWMKKAPNSSPSIFPNAVSDFYAFYMGFTVPVKCIKPTLLRSYNPLKDVGMHRWADTPELLAKRTIEVLQVVRRSGLKLN